MSTIWTPAGEQPVNPPSSPAAPPGGSGPEGPTDEQMEELRAQLFEAPPEIVIANHCYGLFELAAIFLSGTPPLLPNAQLAIDAMGYLVEGLGPRLGENYEQLKDALSQVRLAYVQLEAVERAQSDSPEPGTNGTAG
jgi:hypothetical protein